MNEHPRSPLDSAALSGIPAWDTAWSFDPAPDAPTYRSLEPGLVAFWTDFLGEPPAALAPVAPDFARALALGIDDPAEGATWLRLPTGGVLAPGTIWKTGAFLRTRHRRRRRLHPPRAPRLHTRRRPARLLRPPQRHPIHHRPHPRHRIHASSMTTHSPEALCGQGTHPAPCPPPAVFQ